MSGRPGFNPPLQDRSRQTLERLLDATEAILADKPIEDIAVTEIAARAGSSVGSFYARFETKEALVQALMVRYHEDVEAEMAEVLNDPKVQAMTLVQRSHFFVARAVRMCRERRGLLRLRLQRMIPGPAYPGQNARNIKMVGAFHELFRSCRSEIRHRDPDRALSFAFRMVDSVVANTVMLDGVTRSFGMIDDRDLVDRMTEAFVSYLTKRK